MPFASFATSSTPSRNSELEEASSPQPSTVAFPLPSLFFSLQKRCFSGESPRTRQDLLQNETIVHRCLPRKRREQKLRSWRRRGLFRARPRLAQILLRSLGKLDVHPALCYFIVRPGSSRDRNGKQRAKEEGARFKTPPSLRADLSSAFFNTCLHSRRDIKGLNLALTKALETKPLSDPDVEFQRQK